MQYSGISIFAEIRTDRRRAERGVAVLSALLLLLLLTGLGLGMVLSVNSGLLVNGYYRNFRGSFYAADSGMSIARQQIISQLVTDANGFTPSSSSFNPPLSLTEDQTIQNSISQGQWQPISGNGQGGAANSWPEQYKITNLTVVPTVLTITCGGVDGKGNAVPQTCNTSPALSTPSAQMVCQGSGTLNAANNVNLNQGFNCNGFTPPSNATSYNYYWNYKMTGTGKALGTQAVTLSESGYLTVSASHPPTTLPFSAYGMFIDQFPICTTFLNAGTISGPAFTNGAWTFALGSSYTFTGTVGQAGSNAGYKFDSTHCDQVAKSSDTEAGTTNTIAPTFQQGFNLGQNHVQLPADSFNQKGAVIDGQGTNGFNQGQAAQSLKTITGTPYPASGTPSTGVYLPYSTSNGTATFSPTGGGILVEGDAGVTVSTVKNGAGIPQQIYTITQTNSVGVVTTTTVTITPGSNPPSAGAFGTGTTVVTQQVGTGTVTSTTINGVPTLQTDSGVQGDATMLYVDGNITSLSGPSSGAAIGDYSNVTITAADSITITGNITYATAPVNSSDVLNSNASQSGVLGIFTAGAGCAGQSGCGNIALNVPTSGQNLEIDASIASISQSGNGGLINNGNPINTLTIVGGRIQNSILPIKSTTRNVLFDQRFANGSVAPPWFPTATSIKTGFQITTQVQRTSWANLSPTF